MGAQGFFYGVSKPCPSPEVEFCLRENYRSRAGLGVSSPELKKCHIITISLWLMGYDAVYSASFTRDWYCQRPRGNWKPIRIHYCQ